MRTRAEAQAQRQPVRLPEGPVQGALPQRVGRGPLVGGLGGPGKQVPALNVF